LYEFSSDQDFGAVLLTEAPVIREAIYGSASLRRWCRDNTAALLSEWPEIRERGLIIITSVYLTNRAVINAWQEKGKKIAIGFEASAVAAFELAPSGTWHSAASSQGWNVFEAAVRILPRLSPYAQGKPQLLTSQVKSGRQEGRIL
jgi:hypothetical protein